MQFDQLKRREFITLLGGVGGDVAARGASAASGNADDWIPQQRVARPPAQFVSAFSSGPG
jgi:hypothetical protein